MKYLKLFEINSFFLWDKGDEKFIKSILDQYSYILKDEGYDVRLRLGEITGDFQSDFGIFVYHHTDRKVDIGEGVSFNDVAKFKNSNEFKEFFDRIKDDLSQYYEIKLDKGYLHIQYTLEIFIKIKKIKSR